MERVSGSRAGQDDGYKRLKATWMCYEASGDETAWNGHHTFKSSSFKADDVADRKAREMYPSKEIDVANHQPMILRAPSYRRQASDLRSPVKILDQRRVSPARRVIRLIDG